MNLSRVPLWRKCIFNALWQEKEKWLQSNCGVSRYLCSAAVSFRGTVQQKLKFCYDWRHASCGRNAMECTFWTFYTSWDFPCVKGQDSKESKLNFSVLVTRGFTRITLRCHICRICWTIGLVFVLNRHGIPARDEWKKHRATAERAAFQAVLLNWKKK